MTDRDKAASFLQGQIDKERQARANAETELEVIREQMTALIQEFTDATDEETPEKIRKNLRGRIAVSLNLLDDLLITGSDGVKASLLKFVIKEGLQPTESENAASDLEKLLLKLSPEGAK